MDNALWHHDEPLADASAGFMRIDAALAQLHAQMGGVSISTDFYV
jgi:hypothetical protein